MAPFQQWKIVYQGELEKGYAARRSGNEGKARVCARRAGGILAGEYLEREGVACASWSAYQRLVALHKQSRLNARTLEIISHLIARVDVEHKLPIEADLLVEVQELCETLLGEGEENSGAGESRSG